MKTEIEKQETGKAENTKSNRSKKATETTEETTKRVLRQCLLPEESEWINLDSQERAPTELAVKAIQDLPIDIRRPIASHIILTGGLMQIPWLRKEFKECIHSVLKKRNGKLDAQMIGTLGAWAGASIFASVIAPEQGVNDQIREFRRD